MSVTVVMYHYVRPLRLTRYPEIKGLDLEYFRQQIAFLKKNYTPITMEHFIAWKQGQSSVPENAVLLTFDDGYADHFQYVFPILNAEKIQGSFYIPASSLLERTVLGVNKIHYILASVRNPENLVSYIDERIAANSDISANLSDYKERFLVKNRWDGAEINYVKRLLQFALPYSFRQDLTDQLFREYVTQDEKSFAEELYLTVDQARLMLDCGMHIGGHGGQHGWLNQLSVEEQRIDIAQSVAMLEILGLSQKETSFCYPYGGYNEDTLNILDSFNFSVAFTVEPRTATLQDNRYTIPRLDTNDVGRGE